MKSTWEKLLQESMPSYTGCSEDILKEKAPFLEELFIANNVRGR